jgi:P4 family phage/plasmid primase-like protien
MIDSHSAAQWQHDFNLFLEGEERSAIAQIKSGLFGQTPEDTLSDGDTDSIDRLLDLHLAARTFPAVANAVAERSAFMAAEKTMAEKLDADTPWLGHLTTGQLRQARMFITRLGLQESGDLGLVLLSWGWRQADICAVSMVASGIARMSTTDKDSFKYELPEQKIRDVLSTDLLPVWDQLKAIKPLASNSEQPKADAPKSFDLRTDALLGASGPVRKAIEKWRKDGAKGDLDNADRVVKWLETNIGRDRAAYVIKQQLDERYLKFLSEPKSRREINGKDIEELRRAANVSLPPVKSCDGDLYLFERNKYHMITNEEFAVRLHTALAPYNILTGAKDPRIGLFNQHVTELTSRYIRGNNAERSTDDIILFRNGYLMDGELHRPNPQLFVTGGPDCNYDASAECPTWQRFVNDQWQDDPASIALLQEMIGLLLVDDLSFQTMFVMVGKPGSGKGTILNVIRHLVGSEFCTSFSVSSLAGSFGLQSFLGKTVAVAPDNRGPFDARHRATARETLLKITGNDFVSVNRKNKAEVPVQLRTRTIMLFNEREDVKAILLDAQGAMARRLRVLESTQSFQGKEDKDLLDKLIAELPGIANWALEGLARLRSQGFTANEATDKFRKLSQSTGTAEFFEDTEIKFPVMSNRLYSEYQTWCQRENRKPKPQNWFRSEVEAANPGVGYTDNARRCTHKGCDFRARYYFLTADGAPEFCPNHSKSTKDSVPAHMDPANLSN